MHFAILAFMKMLKNGEPGLHPLKPPLKRDFFIACNWLFARWEIVHQRPVRPGQRRRSRL